MLERLLTPRTLSYSSHVFPLLIVVCRKNCPTFRNLLVVNALESKLHRRRFVYDMI
jgi:hypothetical protein